MGKAKNIAEGLLKYVVRTPETEKLHQDRMYYCNGCKYNVNARCRKCGCILELKTRSTEESCPINLW